MNWDAAASTLLVGLVALAIGSGVIFLFVRTGVNEDPSPAWTSAWAVAGGGLVLVLVGIYRLATGRELPEARTVALVASGLFLAVGVVLLVLSWEGRSAKGDDTAKAQRLVGAAFTGAGAVVALLGSQLDA